MVPAVVASAMAAVMSAVPGMPSSVPGSVAPTGAPAVHIAPPVAVAAGVAVSAPLLVSAPVPVSAPVRVRGCGPAVMSATRAVSAAAARDRRDHGGGTCPVALTDRRVGAAISHGRRGGQGRPQQDRDRQQTSGAGFVHPGSMGRRALAHAGVGPGSPERVER